MKNSANLYRKFKLFIEKNKLFQDTDKVLLAVSGGPDSMVMAHLFHKAGFNFAIAHCNFMLRGKSADKDELLVKKTAEKYKVAFYIKNFDTKGYAQKHKISIQMAARELRYQWFDELYKEKCCDFVAIAHQKNDSAETLLLNLARGTGIAGLHGIRKKNGIYIRPLLFARRDEIESYAALFNILFRNDASNLEDKYTRNKIRLNILPEFQSINPSIINTLYHSACYLSDVEVVYKKYLAQVQKKVFVKKENFFEIDIKILRKENGVQTLLYELLAPFGFNSSQVEDVFYSIDSISGKVFHSQSHSLLKDREKFIIEPLNENKTEFYTINADDTYIKTNQYTLTFKTIEKPSDFNPKTTPAHIAFLDCDKIKFPIQLRTWEKGDVFVPLGMTRKKKVSDFLIDNKYTIFEKEKCNVVVCKQSVIWIVGMRIDERYKITPATQKILRIEMIYD